MFVTIPDLTDGLEDSKPSPAAEGSDLSKSPGPTDGEKYEKLRGNEIINCTCQVKEEDGLMIQVLMQVLSLNSFVRNDWKACLSRI